MIPLLKQFLKSLLASFKDLLPIILVIGFFQLVVLQQPVPNLGQILAGGLMVLVGLSLFVQGLQMALFPLGEEMAYSFVRKGNLWLLLLFAFTLGFGTTVAEPALIAIAAVPAVAGIAPVAVASVPAVPAVRSHAAAQAVRETRADYEAGRITDRSVADHMQRIDDEI